LSISFLVDAFLLWLRIVAQWQKIGETTMCNHGTLSSEAPGWYVQFQADILLQLPRPNEITAQVADGWHDNRGSLKKTLRVALCPPEAIATAPREFATWKTVKLGTHKSVKDLSKALTDGGFRIGDYAAQIFKKTAIAEIETHIELVLVTVAELGFTKATRRDAIYDRAKELGLDLVPAEVGPQLRLQYTDQPLNEWMVMAMEPIADSDGRLRVFFVEHDDDGQWLHALYGYPDGMWYPDDRWVFARRKQN
jgi:hypothetical protein